MVRTKKINWLLTAMLVAVLTMASVVPAYAADGDDVAPPDTAAETSSTGDSGSSSETGNSTPTGETTDGGETDQTPSDESPIGDEDGSSPSGETGKTTEDTVTPTDETTPTEEEIIPSTAEPGDDAAPVGDASDEAGQPAVETPAETIQEVVESLDSLGLALADENGEVLSMAADETVSALAGDPNYDGVYFKNGTTTFNFYKVAGVCADYYGSRPTCFDGLEKPIETALDYIRNGYVYSGTKKITAPSDGIIRVRTNEDIEADDGTYTDTIYIDSNLGVKQLLGVGSELVKLTGSITIANHYSGFTLSGFTIAPALDVPAVSIYNTSGGITLNDLVIDTSSGTNDGIKVTSHNGSLTIKKVNVTGIGEDGNAGRNGIYIDNSYRTGAISISNSSTTGNASNGIYIRSAGSVTFNGVSSTGNGTDGVETNGYGAAITAKGLTVKNSVFNNNTTDGLNFESYSNDGTAAKAIQGNVSLSDVLAYNNGGNGIHILDYGTITLSQVRARGNGANGAYLDNCNAREDNSVCRYPKAYNISISDSAFNNNSGAGDAYGLVAHSGAGITLKNVDADKNGFPVEEGGDEAAGQGILLYNNYKNLTDPLNLVYTWNTMAVSLTNVSASSNNGNGLTVTSYGAVTLKDAEMSNNASGGYGASITNNFDTTLRPSVTLSNSSGSWNIFDNNANTGLLIRTWGTVSLNYIQAGGNNGDGANINNTSESLDGTGGKNITLNYGKFNGNSGDGIEMLSFGVINAKLGSYNVSGNTGHGVNLDNSGAALPKNISLTGGVFENNTLSAVYILSKGNVTVSSTKANNNQSHGFEIDNTIGTGAGNVTLTGLTATNNSSTTDDVEVYGVYVKSDGNIGVKSLNANKNGSSAGSKIGNGAYFNNSTAETAKTVSISSSHFDENFGYGVRVDSKGAITFTSSYADKNTRAAVDAALAYGAWLNNAFSTAIAPPAVTVTSSYFRSNLGKGLEVDSKGAVTVKSSLAEANKKGGYDINNKQAGLGKGNVTLSGLKAFDNYALGLLVESAGNISASSLNITGNGDNTVPAYGASFDNRTSGEGGSRTVSISSSHFDENFGNGLTVLSSGAISLGSVTADENLNGYGALLNNTSSTSWINPGISISKGSFDSNSGKGIEALSKGSITFNSSGAEQNGSDGATLDNHYYPTNPDASYSITVSGISSRSYLGLNGGSGLTVISYGNISVSNINASDNGTYGAKLDNSGTDSAFPKSISISSSYFDNNDSNRTDVNVYDGLYAASTGAITLNYSDARNNTGYGAYLDNRDSQFNNGITIINTASNYGYYSNNGSMGLYAATTGAMNVSYIEAASNVGDGVSLNSSNFIEKPFAVNLTAIRTLNNGGEGLNVAAYGPVTMSSLRAVGNTGGGGVTVLSEGNYNVTLSGSSIFRKNAGDGISITAGRAISLSGIQAEDNDGNGIFASSSSDTGTGVITIKSSRLYHNGANGISASASGNLILENIISMINTGHGADLSVPEDDEDNNLFYYIYVRNSAFSTNTDAGIKASEKPASLSGTTSSGNAGGDLVY